MIGLAAIVTQIPLADEFRWSGWYLAFHGAVQMLIVLVVFKENWSDLKRASVNCKRLSILSGVAVPFYVSFVAISTWLFYTVNNKLYAYHTNGVLYGTVGVLITLISVIGTPNIALHFCVSVTLHIDLIMCIYNEATLDKCLQGSKKPQNSYHIAKAKFWQGKTLVNLAKQMSFTNILPSQIPDSLK